MQRVTSFIMLSILVLLSACSQFSKSTEKVLTGLQFSAGMSDEEIEEEAHGGQMRNIK